MAGPTSSGEALVTASPLREVDLRLLPVAAGLWSALALALACGHPMGAIVTGSAALVAALGMCVRMVVCARSGRIARADARTLPGQADREARRRGLPRGGAAAAAVLLLGLGLGAVLGGLQLARLHPPQLQRLADQRAIVHAVVQVTSDPRASWPASPHMTPAWSVHARLTELVARGVRRTLRVPVLLRGSSVEGLALGATVQISARADAPWSAHALALELALVGEPRVLLPPGAVARLTSSVREELRDCVDLLPPDAAALLLGLAVGDESTLSPELDDAMTRAGLAHLTAVSGSNFTLVLALVVATTRLLGLRRWARIALPALALVGYVELVRPQPSVLRAAAMGSVALLAFGMGGRRRGASALLASVILLLVLVPAFALSIGFALSVAATAALVVLAAPLTERLRSCPVTRRAPESVLVATAAATAAHLATLPLSVLMGNGISLVAIPANLAVTPLVPPATVLGLAAALVAGVLPGVATALSLLAAPATASIAWVARTAAGAQHAVLAVPQGWGWAMATLAGLVCGGVLVGVLRRWSYPPANLPPRLLVALLGAALAIGAPLLRAHDRRWPPPDWVVLACDVGQGDALLVRSSGSARALLVDTGPDPRALASCLADAGSQRLVVVLTHLHADHIGGLAAVLATGRVELLLVPQLAVPPDVLADVRRQAVTAAVPVRSLAAGDVLSPAPGIRATVLWPARRISEDPENNGSVVLVADASVAQAQRPLRVLLTGDVEEPAQARLLATASPHADVVKVPHHGSRYQQPEFARWAAARLALIPVGQGNDYGHPAGSTVDQYRAAGARVARTDVDGALAVSVRDGWPVLSTQR